MCYYDKEFYCKPNEFEEKILEFKEYLSTSIKKEHREKLNELQNNNEELKRYTLRAFDDELLRYAVINHLSPIAFLRLLQKVDEWIKEKIWTK